MDRRINEELEVSIDKVCHTTDVCGECAGTSCLVGFSRYANNYSRDNDTPIVPNGFSEIPQMDIRGGYEDDDVLRTIAQTLHFCKSCKMDHKADCVLALVRDCMEVILIGEEQDYEGDPITYLKMMSDRNQVLGAALLEIYNDERINLA